jgi:hypothetical protein
MSTGDRLVFEELLDAVAAPFPANSGELEPTVWGAAVQRGRR